MLMCNPPMLVRQPTEGKRLRSEASLIHHDQPSPLHGGMGYIPEDVAGLFPYPNVLAMVPGSTPSPVSLHAAFHEDAYNKRFRKMSAEEKHRWIKKFARDCKEGIVVGCHTDFVGPEKRRRVSFAY